MGGSPPTPPPTIRSKGPGHHERHPVAQTERLHAVVDRRRVAPREDRGSPHALERRGRGKFQLVGFGPVGGRLFAVHLVGDLALCPRNSRNGLTQAARAILGIWLGPEDQQDRSETAAPAPVHPIRTRARLLRVHSTRNRLRSPPITTVTSATSDVHACLDDRRALPRHFATRRAGRDLPVGRTTRLAT
mgnify:CR=1 FL=1